MCGISICVYVSMCVSVYVCMDVCVYVNKYVCVHAARYGWRAFMQIQPDSLAPVVDRDRMIGRVNIGQRKPSIM